MSTTSTITTNLLNLNIIETLQKTFNHSTNYLENLSIMKINSTIDINELRQKLGGPMPIKGINSTQVIDDLIENTKGGHINSVSGRFFAWVVGGTLPSALAADWMTSVWDQGAVNHVCSPSSAVVEEIVGEWLIDLLNLPSTCSFALTSGCQLAHFTCLAAARYEILNKIGWNVNEDGLFGAPKIRIIVNKDRHGSVDRALRYLGIGMKSIVTISLDESGRINISEFKNILLSENIPTIVILNAADLNIGAYDQYEEIIPLAQSYGSWVHIDGAFGLIARASHTKKYLLNGVELADSWAFDAHKWLNVPYDSGLAFVRHSHAHYSAMSHRAVYITYSNNARDQIDWNPEWSRRARGYPLYCALRELGKDGISELIDRCCRLCHDLVIGICSLPGTQLLWEPHLNQGLIRFLSPNIDLLNYNNYEIDSDNSDSSDNDNGNDDHNNKQLENDLHDKYTQHIINQINLTGEAYFSSTKWNNMVAMRVSLVNWRTNDNDIQRTIEVISNILLHENNIYEKEFCSLN